MDRLKSLGLLSQPNTPQTYYSVPWKVRKQLGIPNVSNDGWGERSPSENTLHRVGIDLVALFVASRSDVDRVVRYCDVWRLQPTTCWDNVSHLSKKRLDVVGFSQGEPVVVAEVETESGDSDGAQGTVEKLAAFPDRIDRYFVTPNGKHLPAILSRLSASNSLTLMSVGERRTDIDRLKFGLNLLKAVLLVMLSIFFSRTATYGESFRIRPAKAWTSAS
ncbi:hypothetical protein [Halorubrum sp. 2020YC2]|uniref:hypothetical protein n=1 Tax=Halorubrum sp. 2020YC2 TaxID=2836432 RepID=UPI001BEC5BF7|nr:hypothetical protein [Halorubrum sp. 2020YC2]QWC20692.1 hypothetical protein KI388_07120 [Halorubrum sp. 2020YC2]